MIHRSERRAYLFFGTAVAILALLVVTAPPAFGAAPTISSFAPTSGPAGCVVTITGTNFTSPLVSGVDFNGVPAAVGSVTATQIRATVPAGATDGPIHVTSADGTATSSNFDVTSGSGGCAPAITSFSPTSGTFGTSVTINGTNFGGAMSVTFNNVSVASLTVNAVGSQIATAVPSGATTGRIRVTTAVGTATSANDFTVTTAGSPTITSFSPTSGPVGTSVTVNGTNLTGATAVTFNNVAASFSVMNATRISATVPNGATSGRIRVTTPAGTATSSSNFNVTTTDGPTITSFSPTSGPVGTSVTINGTNFTGATAVTFNNVSASFSVTNATRITATVPNAATTGRIRVTTPAGTATSSGNFQVTSGGAPTITSFSPTSGPVGTSVTINGTNFTGATAVTFNNVAASFSVTNATRITATVPNGATTGRIRVTTRAGTASSSSNFTVTTPATQHARGLSLHLGGHLRARGDVRVPDGFAACVASVPVKIQRLRSGDWRTLVTILTRADGSFRVHLADRPGAYRAKATRFEPAGGGACARVTSATERHRH